MNYTVLINKKAIKSLECLPKKDIIKINECIQALKDNPRPINSKKLISVDDLYRIRVGKYRVIYTIKDNYLIIEIINIGHRKEIYSKL